MAIHALIPTPLRKFTQDTDQVEVTGSTVGETLEDLVKTHPELKSRVFDEQGKVRRFINVFVNEEDVRFMDQMETAVEDGDEISIVPAIAGGCR